MVISLLAVVGRELGQKEMIIYYLSFDAIMLCNNNNKSNLYSAIRH